MADRGAVGAVSLLVKKPPVDGYVPPYVPVSTARILRITSGNDTRGYTPRSIRGQVTEAGSTVIGSRLSLIPHDLGSSESPRNAWSGTDGRYAFKGLRPGRYIVTAHKLSGEFRSKSVHVDTEL